MDIKTSLRVLSYHDVAPAEQKRFAAQIRWLANNWQFVSGEQFAAMMGGTEPIKGRNLLLTFDDGFISNRWVADTILNPMGIRALFFVPTDFIDVVDDNAQRSNNASRFYPNRKVSYRPKILRFMGWGDIGALLEGGHSIGAHTRSHACLSDLTTENDLFEEIVASANILESKLDVRIQHFAYPFGNLKSFSTAALEVARRRFSFVYSGLRGDNVKCASPWAVRRDAISPNDSISLVGAILEGCFDFRYMGDVVKLEAWGTKPQHI